MLGDIWVYKKTSRIYVTLLLLAVIMLATQNWQLGVLLFIIVAGCIVYTKRCDLTQEKKLMKYLDDLSAGVSAGTVYAACRDCDDGQRQGARLDEWRIPELAGR